MVSNITVCNLAMMANELCINDKICWMQLHRKTIII